MEKEQSTGRELRVTIVCCRFTSKEIDDLKKKYYQTRYRSLSAFIRDLVLRPNVVKRIIAREQQKLSIQKLEELRREIGYVGNNINQVAKKVNSQNFAGKHELTSIFHELQKIHDSMERL